MVIVDLELAARIERAEAEFMAACSRAAATRYGVPTFRVPIAGGFATYAGDDSPFSKVAGTGFGGVPTGATLDDVERRYAEHRSPVGFEISTLAEPALFEMLTGRDYLLVGFEDVLVRALSPRPRAAAPPDREIAVTRAEDRIAVWMDVAVESALTPDDHGVPQLDAFPRQALETAEQIGIDAGARAYLATVGGRPAGAGGLRISGVLAQLTGAGTLPTYRRRGVQAELVRVRLADARAAGCEHAVVTTQPGSTSQANMRRAGFELGYSRAVLARRAEAG